MGTDTTRTNYHKDAFIKLGYWPNEVLWKVWVQAIDVVDPELAVERKARLSAEQAREAAERQAQALARAVMLDQVSNDCVLSNDDFHEGDFIDVFRVSLKDGTSCYFGVESAAQAYANHGSLGVEEIRLPRRKFVLYDSDDTAKQELAKKFDDVNGTPCQQISWQQRAEAAEARVRIATDALRHIVSESINAEGIAESALDAIDAARGKG